MSMKIIHGALPWQVSPWPWSHVTCKLCLKLGEPCRYAYARSAT